MKTISIFLLVVAAPLPLLAQSGHEIGTELSTLADQKRELAEKIKAIEAREKELMLKLRMTDVDKLPPKGGTIFTDKVSEFAKKQKAAGNSFMVRQSVLDKTLIDKPALLQYSAPRGGSDSFAADLGISYNRLLFSDSTRAFPNQVYQRILTEYHYTDGKEEKNSFIAGLGHDFFLGASSATVQRVSLDTVYKRDEVLAGDAASLSLVWQLSSAELPIKIGDFWMDWGFMSARIAPYVGFEAEFGDGAIKGTRDGDRTSLKAGVALTGLLFPDYLGNRLEMSLAGSGWSHLNRSGAYEQFNDCQFAASASLTYWLDAASDPLGSLAEEEKHFGITTRYLHGDNPLTSEFDQNLWSVGFSVKY